jgi:cell shape-determining protein MreC
MIDLYKHKQTRSAKKIFIVIIALLAGLLVFFLIFFRLNENSLNESVWRIGLKGQSVPKVFASYLKSKNKLQNENIELRNKLDESNLQILSTTIYKDENKKLKEILGRKEHAGMVLAQILSKPNKSPYDIIVVDVGSVDGITVGQKVVAKGSVPIGEIAEVGKKNSKAKLYSTPGTITEALFEGSQIDLDLKGTGSGGFEITIPKDVEVHVGQAILSKQIYSHIIALVSGVVSTEHDSYKKVLAKSPINIQELSWVQIVTE